MKKLNYLVLCIIVIILHACAELKNDEYHKLSSDQHFDLTSNEITILAHNNELDTLIIVGIIKAEFEDELYTGIHCKGPYDYIEFESVYYAFVQDTSSILHINAIKNPSDLYGYCHSYPPSPEECIMFFLGIPNNSGQVKNAPILKLNNTFYYCNIYQEEMSINSVNYTNVFKYELDGVEFKTIGFIENIYMTKSEGIIKIETTDNINWEKTE